MLALVSATIMQRQYISLFISFPKPQTYMYKFGFIDDWLADSYRNLSKYGYFNISTLIILKNPFNNSDPAAAVEGPTVTVVTVTGLFITKVSKSSLS